MFQIVHHLPVGGAGVAGALFPPFQTPEVAARVDVVGGELGDVERDDADALQVDGKIPHGLVVQLFLHVGENQDGLLSGAGFVQEFRGLDHAAGDVGIGAAFLEVGLEGADLAGEFALLAVGLHGVLAQGHLGDDVLLGEAAALYPRHRERVAGLERAKQVTHDTLRLVELLRIGARGVHQHVYRLRVAALVGAGGGEQGEGQQRNEPPALQTRA